MCPTPQPIDEKNKLNDNASEERKRGDESKIKIEIKYTYTVKRQKIYTLNESVWNQSSEKMSTGKVKHDPQNEKMNFRRTCPEQIIITIKDMRKSKHAFSANL